MARFSSYTDSKGKPLALSGKKERDTCFHASMSRVLSIPALVFFVFYSAVALADDLDGVKNGVVKITSTVDGRNRVGTGVVVKTDGNIVYIMTVSHVIEGDPAPKITFHSQPNRKHAAQVIGIDARNPKGLASLMVQVDLPERIQPLKFEQRSEAHSGESVMLIGFPRIPPVPWAVTRGNVTGQVGSDLIISGKASEGNSGGPVIVDDEIIGVVTEVTEDFVYAVPVIIARVALNGWGISLEEKLSESIAQIPQPRIAAEPPSDTSTIEETGVGSSPITEEETASPETSHQKDDSSMVLIPSGKFLMGSEPDEVCEWDSVVKFDICLPERNADYTPQHEIMIDQFYLDVHEVTMEQFNKFIKETGYTSTVEQKGRQMAVVEKSKFIFGKSRESDTVENADWLRPLGNAQGAIETLPNHPVIQISWFDAQRYCEWLGKRLPTEAEWEYAARAGTTTKHWWGNQTPSSKVGNLPDRTFKVVFDKETDFERFDDGVARLSLVGTGSPNPWGLYDMAGNVWEWTKDWYDPKYYSESLSKNPSGPETGSDKVKRGGSWYAYQALKVRAHQPPEDSDDQTGFRCARDVEE